MTPWISVSTPPKEIGYYEVKHPKGIVGKAYFMQNSSGTKEWVLPDHVKIAYWRKLKTT